jgi:hypothetical protein
MNHPDCAGDPADCRVRTLGTKMTTAIDWTPVYDGHGVMTNNDPNTYATEKICDTCSAEWAEERTGSELVVVTITAPPPAQQQEGAA